MTVCLRYVLNDCLHKDFMHFISISDMTGDGLAQIIMAQLKGYQLDLRYFVGQGYDGASAMSGLFHGVQAIIRKECPTALYVHCASHLLILHCPQLVSYLKFAMLMVLLEKSPRFLHIRKAFRSSAAMYKGSCTTY